MRGARDVEPASPCAEGAKAEYCCHSAKQRLSSGRWVTLTAEYDLKVPVMSTLTKYVSHSRTILYADSCRYLSKATFVERKPTYHISKPCATLMVLIPLHKVGGS